MSRPDAATTLAVVEAGIAAVTRGVRAREADAATPREGWTALDLARHVEAIAGGYLPWAGSAVGGRVARMPVGADLHRYDEVMLHRLPRLSMAEHATRLLVDAWDDVLARVTGNERRGPGTPWASLLRAAGRTP